MSSSPQPSAAEGTAPGEERVVLAKRTPRAMVPMQWTGAEPDGLVDPEWAAAMGAAWEGAELVTYDLPGLRRGFEQWENQYLEDSD